MNIKNDIKKIVINPSEKEMKTTKKINYEKEIKMRVETKTWGLKETELSNALQLQILTTIVGSQYISDDFKTDIAEEIDIDKNKSLLISHIKNKISSYKQQDIIKKKLNNDNFVRFDEVLKLLNESKLNCHYCSEEMYILYERVREMKQWSLDRVNNEIGHNKGNLVVACLECNLKRRRTNKDAFMFTKNMVITREGI